MAAKDFPGAGQFLPSGEADLKVLADAAAQCRGCDLFERATQVVFGSGNPRAQVVLDLRDEETRAYRLGFRLFALAARVAKSRLLADAPPILRGLVRELGESAHLSVREGDRVLTLLSESPEATLHAPGRVGGLTPLASTSAGRALVLDLGAEELDAIGLGPHAAAIAEARSRGYALVREESCGGHFREEHQTADGEAQRDDEHFGHVAAWEYTAGQPMLHREALRFEHVHPTRRSYT